MKKHLLFMILISVALSTSAAEKTITLDIPKMYCPICPITVKKALNSVDGVISTQANSNTKTATVIFDTDKTTSNALLNATANAGYPSQLRSEQ